MKKTTVITIATSVVSAAAASGVTWFLTKKHVEEQAAENFDARITEEVKKTVAYLAAKGAVDPNVNITDDIEDDPDVPEDVVLKVPQSVGEYNDAHNREIILGPVASQVQANKPDLDSVSEEIQQKNQAVPYNRVMTESDYPENSEVPDEDRPEDNLAIISRETFDANVTGWEQIVLSYFIDDACMDENREYVPNHEEHIGAAPYSFGHLSGDPNVIYLQNHKEQKEYMVINNHGRITEFIERGDDEPGEELQHSMDNLRNHYEDRRLG